MYCEKRLVDILAYREDSSPLPHMRAWRNKPQMSIILIQTQEQETGKKLWLLYNLYIYYYTVYTISGAQWGV